MRPVRLELEGFSAYREPTVVDFDGADLFALTGATGAGKTAVLDAIAFALYGVVHRLGNKAVVAPAISQGLVEARVRLDFLLGDEPWTAVRVVRRTKAGGATTAEARLEGPDGVVAGTADEVTERVTELLGLSYEHFSRCVVLPQGEFARFLHDKAADRQDLLVSLLDLRVYERMAERAGRRAREATTEGAHLEGRLAELAPATPAALADATARVASLASLLESLDAELPAIAALADEEAAARADAEARAAAAGRLAAIVIPADVACLTDTARAADAALADADAACERTDTALEAAEAARAALPERAAADALLASFERREKERARRSVGEQAVADRRADLVAADAALASARQVAGDAEAAHRAHAVRADLVVGEPCPVCEQVVAALPAEAPPVDLTAARAAVEVAEVDRQAAATELVRYETTLAGVVEALAALDVELGERCRDEVEATVTAIAEADASVKAARAAAREARAEQKAARGRVADAATALADARRRFDDARDAVAGLGAPARTGSDLAEEWAALAAWAASEAPSHRAAAEQAVSRADELGRQRQVALDALARRCVDAGVEIERGASARDAVAAAHAKAVVSRDRLAEQLATAEEVRAELAAVVERRDVAKALAMHLDARHFEQWVLDEAVRGLAEGATELLRTLSGGHYSLAVDRKGGFVVVDHRNADETRPARTLSGGETFLASLALALALADRIATMAAAGAARLDAIFLDEGFGTLDADTLDVVASAIEELGAAGRMVGIVSHVAELAERVPVRFEVTRTGTSSTITRVDR